ncbi:MAG TPA: MtaA/CmuA family methyltransferase [Clostridiaceae bacterium]|nr:MtaA/CmuA family methyltransferase [Clostridiaceae bacterium]
MIKKSLNYKEQFFAYLNGQEIENSMVINPVSAATSESCKELGIRFNEVHLDSDKMAALAAYPYEKLGFASIMPYFSVTQEAAAFGCKIDWGDMETMPNQKSTVFSQPDEFKMPEDFLDRIPIKTVLDAIKKLRNKMGKDALIIGKVMGPWTLSYHLHGLEDFLIETITEPDTVREFLNLFKEISIKFAQAQFEAGADVVTIADHATADLVSAKTYKEYLLPVHKEINEYFGKNKMILHCCGYTIDRIPFFAEAGFSLFHFDSKNDIQEAMKAAGTMRLTGCVNNPDILLNGSVDDVKKQVEYILENGIKIVSPECALPLRVKNKNLMAIYETIQNYEQK